MGEKRALKKRETLPVAMTPLLLHDLRRMIEETRHGVAATVNVAMTHLYWQMGKRIKAAILNGERAEYGIQILSTVSDELKRDYGNGFDEKNLRRMIQFSEVFPDEKIVVSLIRQLNWTHIVALIPLKKPLQRDFYAEMCRIERWSVRTLRQKIDSMLYERTAPASTSPPTSPIRCPKKCCSKNSIRPSPSPANGWKINSPIISRKMWRGGWRKSSNPWLHELACRKPVGNTPKT